MNTGFKTPELRPKDVIVNYLDDQIQKHMEFECMPENDDGYYFVSRSNIGKIVDGLIPLVKQNFKNNNPSELLKQNKELQDWKESALDVLNKIQLQKIGSEIGLELGDDISDKILPFIQDLNKQNKEMGELLEKVKTGINMMAFDQLENLYDDIEQFLTPKN